MTPYEDILDYRNLEEIVIVANTPMFLYSNFQKNQSLLNFSFSFSDQQLIDFFYSEYNGKRTFRNLVNLYSCIVAISLKDSSYVYGFFKNLKSINNLKWASELADIYFSKISYSIIPEENVLPNLTTYNSLGADTQIVNFNIP